jgi:hypothetical protein
MKKVSSLWFPNLSSWISAIVLALTTGLLVSGMGNVVRMTQIFDRLSPRWDLFAGMLAMLSPILMIAFGHHLINLFLDKFFPDPQIPESERLRGFWPSLVSWWEGLYGWLVIILATVLCVGIGGLLLPSRTVYYGNSLWVSQIYAMLIDPNKFKYIFSPPFILWIFSAAYLYQFEAVMRLHFAYTASHSRR